MFRLRLCVELIFSILAVSPFVLLFCVSVSPLVQCLFCIFLWEPLIFYFHFHLISLAIYSFWMLWTSVNSFVHILVLGKCFILLFLPLCTSSYRHLYTSLYMVYVNDPRTKTQKRCENVQRKRHNVYECIQTNVCNIKTESKQMCHYIKLRNIHAFIWPCKEMPLHRHIKMGIKTTATATLQMEINTTHKAVYTHEEEKNREKVSSKQKQKPKKRE